MSKFPVKEDVKALITSVPAENESAHNIERKSLDVNSINDLFRIVLGKDYEIQKLNFEINKSGIGIDQSKSIILPRIDISASNSSYYRKDSGWDIEPGLGLIVKYDVNSLLFMDDIAHVALIKRDLLVLKKTLLVKQKIVEFIQLLSEYHFSLATLVELKKLAEILSNINTINASIQSVVPGSEIVHHDDFAEEKISLQIKILKLESDLAEFSYQISEKTGITLNVKGTGLNSYLEAIVTGAGKKIEENTLSDIVREGLYKNHYVSIFENQLFLSQMEKLEAEREGLPKMYTSLRGGHFSENDTDEADSFIWQFEIRFPLYDGGDLKRNISLKDIAIKKTKADIQNEIRKHYSSLHNVVQKFTGTKKQQMLSKQQCRMYLSRVQSLSEIGVKRSTRTGLQLNAEKKFRISKIGLLEKERLQTRAALEFSYHSGLSFYTTSETTVTPVAAKNANTMSYQ